MHTKEWGYTTYISPCKSCPLPPLLLPNNTGNLGTSQCLTTNSALGYEVLDEICSFHIRTGEFLVRDWDWSWRAKFPENGEKKSMSQGYFYVKPNIIGLHCGLVIIMYEYSCYKQNCLPFFAFYLLVWLYNHTKLMTNNFNLLIITSGSCRPRWKWKNPCSG